MSRTCLSVVLAAGEGTRMKSRRTKVLHAVAGRPLVAHVLASSAEAGADAVALVVGRDADAVSALGRGAAETARCFEQTERLGTAHAVLAARDAIAEGYDDVLVLFGDTPLLSAETLRRARIQLADGAAVCVVGFEAADPAGYGRLLMDGAQLAAIREDKDATPDERRVRLCNSGVMALDGRHALALLDLVGNENAKGEFYLTDVVEIARSEGLGVRVVLADEVETLGVNTRADLARVEQLWQERRRAEMMAAGVTLVAPQTVFFSADTRIEADVVVEPNVVFGPGVSIGTGTVVHAFSHVEGATIGTDVSIGPFARLRPGTEIEAKARVGNFVETKNTKLAAGAKVNHLTYLGDASVGPRSNIGAGTITCNYDGHNKFRTAIGADAFVGSNSSLVAPIVIGDGAYVGSGSVVTEDVPDEALAIGRARQVTKPGRGAEINARNAARKSGRA
ncbi:bifunctional UDP-N-acetylglucosamine diphosphorylase/glucosamine-1-phosphate N-acetyltransferase GlmU [Aureimonas flava]|uniref:Bifunctional protein GlmU n=1 Tax=Aureimonas flava TaxID=2320271 RepID=A0A3A1WME7_9HYPH|nr:bifunctional UDP-N-acetylglucosamine diphosphorylase/glucosamine-1-phosphate N-acetyltransferase GlmU [Aureimonas flava]RIY01605.1 bifunctional UDP-N-acetylglucosamine diphosphorylase/glucosamine-1-phosphate N-acetyltransferase GlmU [Aureimonas flava]